jgi:hypothetical protein
MTYHKSLITAILSLSKDSSLICIFFLMTQVNLGAAERKGAFEHLSYISEWGGAEHYMGSKNGISTYAYRSAEGRYSGHKTYEAKGCLYRIMRLCCPSKLSPSKAAQEFESMQSQHEQERDE